MHRFRPTAPPIVARLAGPTLIVALASLLLLALHGRAEAASSTDAPLPHAELAIHHGGTCSSSCDDGGSGGSGGDDDEPDKVGQPYWVEARRVLRSSDGSAAELQDYVANRSDSPVEHTFSYRYRVVRDVGFSGGYASFFTVKIGGETDRTWTRSLKKVLQPWQVGKIYTSLQTDRYTTYGERYQDYDDGSRQRVGRDSGPYTHAWTRTSYVTYSLK